MVFVQKYFLSLLQDFCKLWEILSQLNRLKFLLNHLEIWCTFQLNMWFFFFFLKHAETSLNCVIGSSDLEALSAGQHHLSEFSTSSLTSTFQRCKTLTTIFYTLQVKFRSVGWDSKNDFCDTIYFKEAFSVLW